MKKKLKLVVLDSENDKAYILPVWPELAEQDMEGIENHIERTLNLSMSNLQYQIVTEIIKLK